MREYREELDKDNWKQVYERLWEERNITANSETELIFTKLG